MEFYSWISLYWLYCGPWVLADTIIMMKMPFFCLALINLKKCYSFRLNTVVICILCQNQKQTIIN